MEAGKIVIPTLAEALKDKPEPKELSSLAISAKAKESFLKKHAAYCRRTGTNISKMEFLEKILDTVEVEK
jgi:hypothetical protein